MPERSSVPLLIPLTKQSALRYLHERPRHLRPCFASKPPDRKPDHTPSLPHQSWLPFAALTPSRFRKDRSLSSCVRSSDRPVQADVSLNRSSKHNGCLSQKAGWQPHSREVSDAPARRAAPLPAA